MTWRQRSTLTGRRMVITRYRRIHWSHPQPRPHAEWIVATGQGGHIGASGSDETVRVSWTGYGGGAAIQCDENGPAAARLPR